MARMYPEVFPGEFDQGNPEFVIYQTLRMLPESYVVLYSKRIKSGLFSKPECEIDFIISNQRDVVICLEVKGGLLAYDGVQDHWLQNGKIMEKGPSRQATEATHCLLHELSKELRNTNVDWALCFPQCSIVDGKSPTGIPLSHIFDEPRVAKMTSEFPKLEEEVRSTFGKRGMTGQEAHDLLERLTRSIGFLQIIGVRIAREAKQLIQATEEQLETLIDLEINPKMIVHGSAGTGKTVLAQELAKRHEASGKNILFLFYNKGIAAHVRDAFQKKSKVVVGTFSSFAKRLIEANDPKWWHAQTNKDNEFWTITLPSKLWDVPAEMQPKFDAIIVDEGQDFKPEWFEYLQTLLKDKDDSYFSVFLDEHQDIFGHWTHFPSATPPAKKILKKNCRNTKLIIDYLNKVYPTSMGFFEKSPQGMPVVERLTQNKIEEQTQIVRDIKDLIGKEQILPGSIVILLNSKKEESCLSETNTIAGYPLVSTYEGYFPRSPSIYYSTIESFKGLEADVVLLVLGDKLDSEGVSKALYVQGSRAKHLLYIYRRNA